MLSIRHSIGKTPLLEHMANDSKSVAHFRCYAIPPPTGVYALEREERHNRKEESLLEIVHRKESIEIEVSSKHLNAVLGDKPEQEESLSTILRGGITEEQGAIRMIVNLKKRSN